MIEWIGSLPWGQGAAYIVLRGYHASWDQNDLNKWFRLILGGSGGTIQKMDRSGPCSMPVGLLMGSVGPWWWKSGPSLVGAFVSSCPFRKTIIASNGVWMRKLCPFYRTPLSDWYLHILNSEYGKWYIFSIISTRSSQYCTLILHLRYF
jgi:hypothetical protein